MEFTNEQKQQIKEVFANTGADQLIVTSDGTPFTEEYQNAARLHAAENDLSLTTVSPDDVDDKQQKQSKSSGSKKQSKS